MLIHDVINYSWWTIWLLLLMLWHVELLNH